MSCKHLKDLLKIEIIALKEEIERDKWFQSERAGRDIGWKEAEKHYLDTHLKGWAKGFKDCYCARVCVESNCQYKRRTTYSDSGTREEPKIPVSRGFLTEHPTQAQNTL
jgi:hypothetical protein